MKPISILVWLSSIYYVDSSSCLNNSTYVYEDPTETCNSIRWNEERRQELCQLTEVRSNCPQSCGICCENDPAFQFKVSSSSVKRDCSWIETFDKHEYCRKKEVKFSCPLACGICREEVQIVLDPPPLLNNERPNEESSSDIIIGSIVAAMSALGLIAFFTHLRGTKKVIIMTELERQKTIRSNDVEESSQELENQSSESEDEFETTGVAPNGVSVFWINSVFVEEAKKYGLINSDTSIYQLDDLSSNQNGVLRSMGEYFVCPRDGEVGAAIVDSIDNEEHTGPSNLILNCSEKISIEDVVSTLLDFCIFNNCDAKRTYVWAPFLCINYHRLSSRDEMTEENLKFSLQKRIASVGRLLTIVSPWVDEARNLSSISGLYELYTAIDIGCKVIITTTTRDKNFFIETLPNECDITNLFNIIDQIRIQDIVPSGINDEQILRLVCTELCYDQLNGKICNRLRRWAKKEILDALKYHEKRSKDAARDEDYAFICSQVGYAMIRVDEGTDGIALYNKAMQILKNVRGEAHTDVASLYMNTGMVLQATGDFKGAMKEYQKVLDIHQFVYGEEHIETANTYENIGRAMEAEQDFNGAVANYQKSLLIREKLFGSDNPFTAQSYNDIGFVLNSLKEYEQSLTALERARDIYLHVKGSNHSYTAQAYTNVGYVQQKMGKNEDALKSFQFALDVVKNVKGEAKNEEAKANAYTNVGMILESMGSFDAALSHYKIALSINENTLGRKSAEVAMSHINIGNLMVAKSDYNSAIEEFEIAYSLLSLKLGPVHHQTLAVKANIQKCKEELRVKK